MSQTWVPPIQEQPFQLDEALKVSSDFSPQTILHAASIKQFTLGAEGWLGISVDIDLLSS